MDHAEHMAANRKNWDDRAELHARGDTGYRLDRYRADRELLSGVITFDQPYLGDLTASHTFDSTNRPRVSTEVKSSRAALNDAGDWPRPVTSPSRWTINATTTSSA